MREFAMPEQVRCPSCSAALRVPDSLLGRNVKCPKCQTTFIAEGEEIAHPKGIVQEPTPAVTRPRLPADDEDLPPEDEERDEREERDELEDEDRPRRGRRRRRYRSSNAEAMVSGPAIAMMVASILGIITNLGYLTFRLITLATLDKQMLAQQSTVRGAQANPGAFQAGFAFGVTTVVVTTLLGALLCVIILVGSVQMKKLKNYGLAMSASVLALLPCNCCCLLCMPFGIWSLVVLNNPEVKDAFS
jgi:predicted Zn finger-like uncharacterized protein